MLKKQEKCRKIALFCKNIWSYQKKAVPLHPLSKRKSTVTNGIKAITSDFGSENLGSIPGWSTQKKPACRAFFERNLKRVMGYGQPHKQYTTEYSAPY